MHRLISGNPLKIDTDNLVVSVDIYQPPPESKPKETPPEEAPPTPAAGHAGVGGREPAGEVVSVCPPGHRGGSGRVADRLVEALTE